MRIEHPYVSEFRKWERRLGDNDRAAIARRLILLAEHGVSLGMPNVRRINPHVYELRVPSGIRLYFTADEQLAVFVRYGNKDTQQRDIVRATQRAQEFQQ